MKNIQIKQTIEMNKATRKFFTTSCDADELSEVTMAS